MGCCVLNEGDQYAQRREESKCVCMCVHEHTRVLQGSVELHAVGAGWITRRGMGTWGNGRTAGLQTLDSTPRDWT